MHYGIGLEDNVRLLGPVVADLTLALDTAELDSQQIAV